MPSFYPAMSVSFVLHFDETLHVVDTPLSVPGQTPAPPSAPSAADLLNAQFGRPKNRSGGNLILNQLAGKNASFVYDRTPKSGSVDLPGYRQAATFNLTFDFVELPIDPRTVRSAAVEIHVGAVPPDQFGEGMTKSSRAARLKITTAAGEANPDTLAVFGLVDEWDVEHGAEGSTITISGRDLRGIMLDTPIGATDPKDNSQVVLESLDLSKPINEVLVDLYAFNPMFSDIVPKVDKAEWKDGIIPAPGAQNAAPRVRKGADGKRKGARASIPSSESRASFWDLTVRLCYLAGAIPYFVGKDLLVRPARSVFAQQEGHDDNSLVAPPFAGGKPRRVDTEGGKIQLQVRRLVYGRDVERLTLNRKLAGYKRPATVRVIAVDASSPKRGKARQVEGRYPPEDKKKARLHRVAPGGAKGEEEFYPVQVHGITDPDQLNRIAQSIYEEIGRGEIGGTIETPNLASFGGDNADPDLLKLKPGDAIELMADTRAVKTSPPLQSSFTESLRRGFDAQVKEVAGKLGDENLARVVVATARGEVQELQRAFRVSAVHYSWDHDSGIKVSFDVQNYVEVRADVGSTAQAKLSTAAKNPLTAAISTATGSSA